MEEIKFVINGNGQPDSGIKNILTQNNVLMKSLITTVGDLATSVSGFTKFQIEVTTEKALKKEFEESNQKKKERAISVSNLVLYVLFSVLSSLITLLITK